MIGVNMNLADYLLIADRKLLAKAVGSSPAYLYQVATGRRKASPQLARRINKATCGAVSLHSLRPDVWLKEDTQETGS